MLLLLGTQGVTIVAQRMKTVRLFTRFVKKMHVYEDREQHMLRSEKGG